MSGAITTGGNQCLELDGFRNLLARLDPDPVRAWQAYEDLRKKLVVYFAHNHLLEADELAEEALDRIAKKPDVGLLHNIIEFAFGVARNLRKESLRKASLRTDVPDMEIIADTTRGNGCLEDTIINRISAERKLQCFLKSMQNLSAEEQELVRRYYPPDSGDLETQRVGLAADFGLSIGALRTRMVYIKGKLQDQFDRHYNRPKGEQTQKRDTARSNFCGLKHSNSSGQYKGAAIRIEAEEQRSVNARLWRLQDGVRKRSEGSGLT